MREIATFLQRLADDENAEEEKQNIRLPSVPQKERSAP